MSHPYQPTPAARFLLILGPVLLAPFLFYSPAWLSGPLVKDVLDLGHPLLFGLAVIGWGVTGGRHLPRRRLAAVALLATLAAGGASEYLQMDLPGRDGSLADLGRDVAGAITGLVVLDILHRGRRLIHLLILAPLVVACGLPFCLAAGTLLQARAGFPVLYDFQGATGFLQLRRVSGSAHYRLAATPEGRDYLAVTTVAGATYSGITLHDFPGDWRGFSTLALELANPEPRPLRLYLRIHDRLHSIRGNRYDDRFHQVVDLPANHRYRVLVDLAQVAVAPKERPMAMDGIEAVGLFVAREARPRRFRLLDVRLLP